MTQNKYSCSLFMVSSLKNNEPAVFMFSHIFFFCWQTLFSGNVSFWKIAVICFSIILLWLSNLPQPFSYPGDCLFGKKKFSTYIKNLQKHQWKSSFHAKLKAIISTFFERFALQINQNSIVFAIHTKININKELVNYKMFAIITQKKITPCTSPN